MMIQGEITFFCYALVPILAVLAYRSHSATRAQLQPWRNSIGVVALATIAITWFFWVTMFILGRYQIGIARPYLLSFLYAGPIAAVLAFAIKGRPRTFTIAAGILLWAGLQLVSYT